MSRSLREDPMDACMEESAKKISRAMNTRLDEIFKAGAVRRYHTQRVFHQQSLADHSWGVATIITLLHPNPSALLLKAALLHDMHEVVLGDVPYTAKNGFEDLKQVFSTLEKQVEESMRISDFLVLTDEERSWLKCADMLELVLFCQNEHYMGNQHVIPMWTRGLEVLRSRTDCPKPITDYVNQSAGDYFD